MMSTVAGGVRKACREVGLSDFAPSWFCDDAMALQREDICGPVFVAGKASSSQRLFEHDEVVAIRAAVQATSITVRNGKTYKRTKHRETCRATEDATMSFRSRSNLREGNIFLKSKQNTVAIRQLPGINKTREREKPAER